MLWIGNILILHRKVCEDVACRLSIVDSHQGDRSMLLVQQRWNHNYQKLCWLLTSWLLLAFQDKISSLVIWMVSDIQQYCCIKTKKFVFCFGHVEGCGRDIQSIVTSTWSCSALTYCVVSLARNQSLYNNISLRFYLVLHALYKLFWF